MKCEFAGIITSAGTGSRVGQPPTSVGTVSERLQQQQGGLSIGSPLLGKGGTLIYNTKLSMRIEIVFELIIFSNVCAY
jgi:hypothetical protein